VHIIETSVKQSNAPFYYAVCTPGFEQQIPTSKDRPTHFLTPSCQVSRNIVSGEINLAGLKSYIPSFYIVQEYSMVALKFLY